MARAEFTPAAGLAALTPVYDVALRVLTRERRWREALIKQIGPRHGDAILDVGCGTGTLAIMMKRRVPGARVVGLDPDPAILALAAAKARRAGVDIEWHRGFAEDAERLGQFDHVLSTLVFHGCRRTESLPGCGLCSRLCGPGRGPCRRLLSAARLANASAIQVHPDR